MNWLFESGEALLAHDPQGQGCILLDVGMAGLNGMEVHKHDG
jgi:FixJ family two-component response regulator